METRTGIPTMYQHCQFRSRLEAKWASFFDGAGWKWEYEPFDLNGWIPDFLLIGAKEQVLVEVKPFTSLREFDTEKITDAIRETHAWEGDILLLGCAIFPEYSSLGWLGEYHPTHFDSSLWTPHDFQRAIVTFRFSDFKSEWGFCHECISFRDRITGACDGSRADCNPRELEILWRKAGNNVQWTPTKEA